MSILFLFMILLSQIIQACEIHGTDSGFCETRYDPSTYMSTLGLSYTEAFKRSTSQWKDGTLGPCQYGQSDFCMPFCGRFIAYYYIPCVPQVQPLPRDIHFPQGRFIHHTTRMKDRWIEETVSSIIEYEQTKSKQKRARHRHSRRGKGFHNPDCRESFTRYFCYVNFPRCDKNYDHTLPTCRSVCENFMRSCGYESYLWKCYESRMGYYEDPMTSFFPGQPFVDGTSRSSTTAICTPSIRGNASVVTFSWGMLMGIFFFSTLLIWT